MTEGLAALAAKGKTRSIGLSEIAPSSLRRAATVHPIAAVQSEYSLSTHALELGLVQACAELGTTLVAFSPVGRSLLTDQPSQPEQIKTFPFFKDNPRFVAPNHPRNLQITDGFRALARDMGVPAASLAIAWVMHQGEHVLPIPGTRSLGHVAELVQGAQIGLSAADIDRIEQILPLGWAHGDRYSVAQ